MYPPSPLYSPPLILASASPRRKQLLESIGITPRVIPADLDERACVEGVPVEEQPLLLAGAKAGVIAERLISGDIVASSKSYEFPDGYVHLILAADTVVIDSNGDRLDKPANKEEAKKMLMHLSGKWHTVITGYRVLRFRMNFAPWPSSSLPPPSSAQNIKVYLDDYSVKRGVDIQTLGVFPVEKERKGGSPFYLCQSFDACYVRLIESDVITRVHFRHLDPHFIDYYVNSGESLDKAGGYGIQDSFGYYAVDKIEGSFTNVMGLPIDEVALSLRQICAPLC